MGIAETGKWLKLFGLYRQASRLPLPAAYAVASAIGNCDYTRQPELRKAIGMSLARGLPGRLSEPGLQEHWVRQYFLMMSREIMDAFVMNRVNQSNSRQLVDLDPASLALFRECKREGRGTILVMNHFGRLNLLLLALSMAGHKLGMLTIAIDERNPDLSKVDRKYLGQKVGALQTHTRGRWITLGDNLRGLYEGLKCGETIVILVDAYQPGRGESKLRIPFLGGQLEISQGIARLAEKTGANLVYGSVYDTGWQAHARIRPLPDDANAALMQTVAYLEQDVLDMPWLWWHWNILDYIWRAPTNHE